MSQQRYESSSCSGGEEEFGLSLHMFDTERTPAEDENLLKELEPTILHRVPLGLKQNSPQGDCPPRNTRIGNIDRCVCSKHVKQ